MYAMRILWGAWCKLRMNAELVTAFCIETGEEDGLTFINATELGGVERELVVRALGTFFIDNRLLLGPLVGLAVQSEKKIRALNRNELDLLLLAGGQSL